MNIMLLAAGEGTRFRPHTLNTPKPALPFCGVPLLHHSYYFARSLRPQKIVINTFHLPPKIKEVGHQLKETNRFEGELIFSDEAPQLLGSAGGMAKAQSHFSEESGFIVMNADEVILPQHEEALFEFQKYAQRSPNIATLMVMEHPEAGRTFGAVWLDTEGQVRGFGKKPPEGFENLRPYHFIGPMFFKKEIFNHLKVMPSNILHDTLNEVIQQEGKVGVYKIECQWFETGNLQDYLGASKNFLMALHRGSSYLREFQRTWLRDFDLLGGANNLLLKHRTATVPSSVRVHGFAIIGAQVQIFAGAHLENVVIADNVPPSQIPIHLKNELVLPSTL